jgi:hypothetical protein
VNSAPPAIRNARRVTLRKGLNSRPLNARRVTLKVLRPHRVHRRGRNFKETYACLTVQM